MRKAGSPGGVIVDHLITTHSFLFSTLSVLHLSSLFTIILRFLLFSDILVSLYHTILYNDCRSGRAIQAQHWRRDPRIGTGYVEIMENEMLVLV